ncbi:M24 family metallopeptidase [Novosphingobium flavum]|uniref:M24 family metallopeptidase n=1 Tax=Novosphingobium flavum TaxID=1778672 RepID=A0A7X1KMV5_9SPHN|nr:M24 family metallopeptidase [Novosphingobium flavum]MBC2667002.1 M24 family metallopeptidase [Novosphingobium flavum]
MVDIAERICNPPSRQELERRWALVREVLREHRCEALIIQAANNVNGTGGHFRWLTGVPVPSSYPQTVIFPADGLATVVMHGGFGERAQLDDRDVSAPGVGLRLFAPSFPGVDYCGPLDAQLVLSELRKAGYRRVGIVAAHNWYASMATGLFGAADAPEFVDLTPPIDVLKAWKSPEEIGFLRQTAAMQDAILAGVAERIKPGVKEFEVMAYAQYLGQTMGSEGGYFLGSSAPPGEPMSFRRRGEQGRELREGDVFYVQCENSGPGGLFTHVGRYFVLGKAPQLLQDMFGLALEAQDFTMTLLEPGRACAGIFDEYNAWMESRGQQPERRVHCHGQGYDVVEAPLIRQDETMVLGANTNIGFHPAITSGKQLFTCCDNIFVGEGGAIERLHKTPRAIVELN